MNAKQVFEKACKRFYESEHEQSAAITAFTAGYKKAYEDVSEEIREEVFQDVSKEIREEVFQDVSKGFNNEVFQDFKENFEAYQHNLA
jgi:hypothetical protein